MISSKSTLALLLIFSNLAAIDFAKASACRIIVGEQRSMPAADLAAQMRDNYDSPNIHAYRAFDLLRSYNTELSSGRSVVEAMLEVMKDEEAASQHLILRKVFEASMSDAPGKTIFEKLENNLKLELEKVMSPTEAASRAGILRRRNISKDNMMDALGRRSLQETNASLVGLGGISNVSADSLVGRYLEESAALRGGVKPATFVGRFTTTPTSTEYGAQRLFISVDSRTARLAEKMFGSNQNLMIHNHTQQQGTLYLHQNGNSINYARHDHQLPFGYYLDPTVLPNGVQAQLNTIAPIISLSTAEGSRAHNYFELGRQTNTARSKYPWSFSDRSNGREENYCRMGGYTSCTHWFGEMPIGDKRVKEYSFPGQHDDHANQADPLATDQKVLRTGPVGKISHFGIGNGATEVGEVTRVDRLTRMVWNEKTGHEQLWSMLGTSEQTLAEGEYANPGYVLYALVGKAASERVQVVLIYRQDATAPLDQTVIDGMKQHVHAY